jgi:CubicO group peptidase (beta-lactamase class C family)
MSAECKSCREVCGAWWAEAAADCVALNAENVEVNGVVFDCDLLEVYDLATDAWYCPTKGEWGDWSAVNGSWEDKVSPDAAKRKWVDDPNEPGGGYYGFADGGGYCLHLCVRKIGTPAVDNAHSNSVGLYKDCTWTKEMECKESEEDCGCGVELPTYWVWPEGNCCRSQNECCEDCEEGDTALYGDLSGGCDKELLTQMNSLQAGPVASLGYNCDLANLADCESDKCGAAAFYEIHKGDTYVVEFETNSINKFNHNNHWWQILFEKCEPEEFKWSNVFDPFIQNLADGHQYATMAISYGGEIVYENYASNSMFDQALWLENYLDLAEGEQPKVNAASNSKMMTGAAIALLYEQGRLSAASYLVDILSRYFYDGSGNALFTDQRYKQITVGMMAHHMGGWIQSAPNSTTVPPGIMYQGGTIAQDLVMAFPNDYPNGIQLPLSDEDLIKFLITQPLEYNPGGGQQYSNIGYFFMKKVIEEVAGMEYERFMQETFLEPAGIDGHWGWGTEAERHTGKFMVDNKYVPPNVLLDRGVFLSEIDGHFYNDQNGQTIVSGRSHLDENYGTIITRGGEGGFVCTAGDFVKWLGLWQDSPDMNAILSSTVKNFVINEVVNNSGAYGQVISPATPNSPAYAYHGGTAMGYASQYVRYIDPRGVIGDAKCAGLIDVYINVQGLGGTSNSKEFIDNEITPRIGIVLAGCKGPTCEPAFNVGDEMAVNGECDPDGGGGGGGGGDVAESIWECLGHNFGSIYTCESRPWAETLLPNQYASLQECERNCDGGGGGGGGGMDCSRKSFVIQPGGEWTNWTCYGGCWTEDCIDEAFICHGDLNQLDNCCFETGQRVDPLGQTVPTCAGSPICEFYASKEECCSALIAHQNGYGVSGCSN